MDQIAIIGNSPESIVHMPFIHKYFTIVSRDVQEQSGTGAGTDTEEKYYETIDELICKDNGNGFMAAFTPVGYHAEWTIKALQAGKHVILSGPLSITTAAAWQMIETEKFCRKGILMCRPWFYNSQVQKLMDKLRNGLRVHSFQWSAKKHLSSKYAGTNGRLFPHGGVLYQEFSDSIDLLTALMGNFSEAKGFMDNAELESGYELETRAAVVVRTEAGVIGSMQWEVTEGNSASNEEIILDTEEGIVLLDKETLDLEKTSYLTQFYSNVERLLQQGNTGSFGSLEALKTVQNINILYKGLTAKPDIS